MSEASLTKNLYARPYLLIHAEVADFRASFAAYKKGHWCLEYEQPDWGVGASKGYHPTAVLWCRWQGHRAER